MALAYDCDSHVGGGMLDYSTLLYHLNFMVGLAEEGSFSSSHSIFPLKQALSSES
jgi:hypothetical protein